MRFRNRAAMAATPLLALSAPAFAQEEPQGPPPGFEDSVFSGDFITVGVGGAVSPSYTGSDNYVLSVLPVIQGSLGGVRLTPRAAGLKVDFLPNPAEGIGFDLGVAARIRSNRVDRISDDVVELYGELDRAIEVGPSVGVSIPKLLNPYDSLSFGTDVMFDVAGAHGGMVVAPSVSYFTPLSRGAAASLSFSAEWADEDFQDYNFRVDPAAYTGPGVSPLAAYEPNGGGFVNAGTSLLVAVDMDGDITNGGLGLIGILGYSRLLGDAANTPFTTGRGSRDQLLGVVGIAYTF